MTLFPWTQKRKQKKTEETRKREKKHTLASFHSCGAINFCGTLAPPFFCFLVTRLTNVSWVGSSGQLRAVTTQRNVRATREIVDVQMGMFESGIGEESPPMPNCGVTIQNDGRLGIWLGQIPAVSGERYLTIRITPPPLGGIPVPHVLAHVIHTRDEKIVNHTREDCSRDSGNVASGGDSMVARLM